MSEALSDGALYGVYEATVLDVRDPEGLGRVRVRLSARKVPGLERTWARLATLMAGDERGTWFVPDAGDQVLVAFEAGDTRRPYIVGALWSSTASPPESMDAAGSNARRVIRTRSGARIVIDDGAAQRVEIADANGNSIVLEPFGISITASAKVRVNASTIEVDAGMLTVNAGMSRFSGVVGCDTLLANSVIASSYTPGAGNIW
jgi:phage baseplate assembly protein V